jgi:lipoyl(octanoyl) transferase
VLVMWLGTVEYSRACRLQDELADLRADEKIADTLLLLEHFPVITLGRRAIPNDILVSSTQLDQLGISVHESDRGGEITYHGPGQLVGYPIVDLKSHGRDLHRFLRELEGSLIDLLGGCGLKGRRFSPHTGVWIGDRKVAALGVKIRRWVSTHGFALNVDPDLSHFDLIVPCGIREHGVTSLRMEGVTELAVADLLEPTASAVRARFGRRLSYCSPTDTVRDFLSAESLEIWSAGKSL